MFTLPPDNGRDFTETSHIVKDWGHVGFEAFVSFRCVVIMCPEIDNEYVGGSRFVEVRHCSFQPVHSTRGNKRVCSF